MSGWHPNADDGGIVANPDDPRNPSQAFPPVHPPVLTAPNYYGNGCDVRLRPAVVNSLISENVAVVDSLGLGYDPSKLTNLRTAIEYVDQKGLPKFVRAVAQGTPANYYRGALTPPLLGGHNNGQVLVVVPDQASAGFVRVDFGTGTWVPVLTDRYAELPAGDWPANTPQLVGYYNGAFFAIGKADLSNILARLAALEARMSALEARVANLEARMSALEARVAQLEGLYARVAALEAAAGGTGGGFTYGQVGSVWMTIGWPSNTTPNGSGYPGSWLMIGTVSQNAGGWFTITNHFYQRVA